MASNNPDQEIADKVSSMFEAANWSVSRANWSRRVPGPPGRMDIATQPTLTVTNDDPLGLVRKITVVCAKRVGTVELNEFADILIDPALRVEFGDNVWFVGETVTDDALRHRINPLSWRTLRISELSNLLALPRPGKGRSRAKTKIGKAVLANESELVLSAAGLILQIDAKIEALRAERPNSGEAVAERDAQISDYEQMRGQLEDIRTTAETFKKDTKKEADVVKSVNAFADGVRTWWNKAHATIINKTFDMGLFTAAVGICSMAGAGGKMAVAVSAVLVGGKPVAQALKGLLPKRFLAD